MSKQEATNGFSKGLNMDLNPISTPNEILTDCLNGTIITYNGNEWNLQNDMGNYSFPGCELPDGFIPIGVKAYGDILYIVSYDNNSKLSQIGTFPSPEYNGTSGDIIKKYSPLQNYKKSGSDKYGDFIANLNMDLQHPIDIEIQESYDGSVNLIINDDKNEPRLINSGFAVREGGRYELIERNQYEQTNKYSEEKLNSQIKLIRTIKEIPRIEFKELLYTGQLKSGNYNFYIKFADGDYNKTDIVCESSTISIFKGNTNSIPSISGGWQSEITDKAIRLKIVNIDPTFSNIYVYYTREYCDANGYKLTEAKLLSDEFNVPKDNNGEFEFIITGVESTEDISIEELNVQYLPISKAKTQAQQQNMLFLANIGNESADNKRLQDLAYRVRVQLARKIDSIGWVNENYIGLNGSEYYDPKNIYECLGYWPEEYYRFGIVFIKNDDTLTPVFNIIGCEFNGDNFNSLEGIIDSNIKYLYSDFNDNGFFEENGKLVANKWGIFKNPTQTTKTNIQQENNIIFTEKKSETHPWYYKFYLDYPTQALLKDYGVKGYFYVRQKRVPTVLCQGLCIGIDERSKTPILFDSNFEKNYAVDWKYNEANGNGTYRRFINGMPLFEWDERKGNETNVPFAPLGGERWTEPNGPGSKYGYFAEGFLSVLHRNYTTAESSVEKKTEYLSFLANDGTSLMRYEDGFNEGSEDNSDDGIKIHPKFTSLGEHIIRTNKKNNSAFLNLDSCIIPNLQSQLNGTERRVALRRQLKLNIETVDTKSDVYKVGNIQEGKFATRRMIVKSGEIKSDASVKNKVIYVNDGTSSKVISDGDKEIVFSTKAGLAEDVSKFAILSTGYNTIRADKGDSHWGDWNPRKSRFAKQWRFGIRGVFCPILGVNDLTNQLKDNGLYNIYTDNYNPDSQTDINNWFVARSIDETPYYAVTDRYALMVKEKIDIFRGDCFTNTITMRLNRNFIDPSVPISDDILQPSTWNENFGGPKNTSGDSYSKMNRADINSVSLGMWVIFKCLSNYNLGLRSEDTLNTAEYALMGNPRSFYPKTGISTKSGTKLSESYLQNQGYNTIVSEKRNAIYKDIPYNRIDYSNRIMFSNVSVKDSFENGYRTFQGLSYRDIDAQYGAITKIVSWGVNLFVVFEHGCGLLAVNPKALLQTTTEQNIHIYGAGVLSNQLDAIVSQDFGSIWKDSIIKTPLGIYGVDSYAKKIWRYTDKKGFETISDMKIQRFLNDNILLQEGDKNADIGIINIKTHYNSYKGDLMFTFYKNDKKWNICYNERSGMWITRYSWIPLFSENVNNIFYSYNLESAILERKYPKSGKFKLYLHGRSGESNYLIKPTNWYDKQEEFNFEFVVNEATGLHKIFENLVIISNNVQPAEIDFELIGDAYLFNKARIYHDGKNIYNEGNENFVKNTLYEFPECFKNVKVEYDPVLNQYNLIMIQKTKNLETFGRRLGNIQYKEDSWYLMIDPIVYDARIKDPNYVIAGKNQEWITTRLRDKWLKIKIKYTGEDLVIITGIKTLFSLSYS